MQSVCVGQSSPSMREPPRRGDPYSTSEMRTEALRENTFGYACRIFTASVVSVSCVSKKKKALSNAESTILANAESTIRANAERFVW